MKKKQKHDRFGVSIFTPEELAEIRAADRALGVERRRDAWASTPQTVKDMMPSDGVRLKTARVNAGLSQRELAALIGINPTSVSKAETGERRPNAILWEWLEEQEQEQDRNE